MDEPPITSPTADRDAWFDLGEVQEVLRAEQRDLIPELTAHIGVRGLYLRPSRAYPSALSGNMLQHIVALHRDGPRMAGDVASDDAHLPLLSDSFSLIYALHALETSAEPEALLAELVRCLQPEGVLIGVLWSRVSPWRWHWSRQAQWVPERARVLAACQQAGLVIESTSMVGGCWPCRAVDAETASWSERWRERLLSPWRTSWAFVGRKRRPGLTAVGRVGRVGVQPRARPT